MKTANDFEQHLAKGLSPEDMNVARRLIQQHPGVEFQGGADKQTSYISEELSKLLSGGAKNQAQVHVGNEGNTLSGLAHELGHHQFQNTRAGKLIQGRGYALKNIAPMVGVGAGMAAMNSDSAAAPWLARGATAATVAPHLISEGMASYNALKMIKNMGGSGGQRSRALKDLVGAGGSYALGALPSVASVEIPLWLRRRRMAQEASMRQQGAMKAAAFFAGDESENYPILNRMGQYGIGGGVAGATAGAAIGALAPKIFGTTANAGQRSAQMALMFGKAGIGAGAGLGALHGGYDAGRQHVRYGRDDMPRLRSFFLGGPGGALMAHQGMTDEHRIRDLRRELREQG